MPAKTSQEIINLIVEAYMECGSFNKTAEFLGVSRNVVFRAIYAHQGRCACGRKAEVGKRTCSYCLEKKSERTKKITAEKKAKGLCKYCDNPLAEGSTIFCEGHRLYNNQKQAKLRQKRKENGLCVFCGVPVVEGSVYCDKHLKERLQHNRISKDKYEYDGKYFFIFEKYEHKCAICGHNGKKKRLEVHHIDGNHSNNEEINLILLCSVCHRSVTFLSKSDCPEKILSFVTTGKV